MSQRHALITGATSGIGYETAIQLAKAGYHQILVGRREERLNELKSKLLAIESELRVHCWGVDITDREKLNQLMTSHESFLNQLSVLVNSAGLAIGTDPVDEADPEDWDHVLNVNVNSLFFLTRKLMPYLKKQPLSDIVNLGSVAGRWVYPGGAVYCASKHAVRAFSEGIRLDLKKSNVRVSNIEPGMVETEFSLVRLKDQEKANQVYEGMTALKPQDIADCIEWVLSRPAHVDIQEMVIYPTDQPSVTKVNRNS